MRPIQIHPLSALAGAVVGVLALLSMSLAPQLTNSGTLRVAVTKPVDVVPALVPHPTDFVTVKEGAAYVVPAGKVLVVTALGRADEIGRCSLILDGVPECYATGTSIVINSSGAAGIGNGTSMKQLPLGLSISSGVTVELDGYGGGLNGRAWGYLVDA